MQRHFLGAALVTFGLTLVPSQFSEIGLCYGSVSFLKTHSQANKHTKELLTHQT